MACATTNPVFWFMMQLAMLAGFLTSYPMNWWLVRAGIKHARQLAQRPARQGEG